MELQRESDLTDLQIKDELHNSNEQTQSSSQTNENSKMKT